MKNWLAITAALALMTISVGCGSSANVEVIDLNTVLDVMVQTMDQLAETPVENATEGENPEDVVAVAESDNAEVTHTFLTTYAKNLNDAKVMSKPVGVSMRADGAIEGFTDADGDGAMGTSDKQLFTVEIDQERSRLIATDTQNSYHRDHGFRISPGGLFMGYMLGSMLHRQRASGIAPSRFSNMKMSPSNYHSSAVSKARARSSGGSRSFSSGK